VLKITPIRLLEPIMDQVENATAEFDQIVLTHITDSGMSARILSNAPSLKQKLDKLCAENLNIDTLKRLIGVGFRLLIAA
jgi:hypothetical protein